MAQSETFYVAAAEGEGLPDSSVWETSINEAKDRGAEECKDSCSGFPEFIIYEVIVTPKYVSRIDVEWDRM